jgi:hypothetical protein
MERQNFAAAQFLAAGDDSLHVRQPHGAHVALGLRDNEAGRGGGEKLFVDAVQRLARFRPAADFVVDRHAGSRRIDVCERGSRQPAGFRGPVALVAHRRHAIAQAEREEDFGRGGEKGCDARRHGIAEGECEVLPARHWLRQCRCRYVEMLWTAAQQLNLNSRRRLYEYRPPAGRPGGWVARDAIILTNSKRKRGNSIGDPLRVPETSRTLRVRKTARVTTEREERGSRRAAAASLT